MRRWLAPGLALVMACCSCGTVVNKRTVADCTHFAPYCEVTAYILDVEDEDTKEISQKDVDAVTYARCEVGDIYPDCASNLD